MPQITITVHNKPYTLSCPAGNEPHVQRLAGHVNAYIDNLIKHGANLSNQGLLVFALLGMAEKIEDLQSKVADLEEKLYNPLASLQLEQAETVFVAEAVQEETEQFNAVSQPVIAPETQDKQQFDKSLKPLSVDVLKGQSAQPFPTMAAGIAAVTGDVKVVDVKISKETEIEIKIEIDSEVEIKAEIDVQEGAEIEVKLDEVMEINDTLPENDSEQNKEQNKEEDAEIAQIEAQVEQTLAVFALAPIDDQIEKQSDESIILVKSEEQTQTDHAPLNTEAEESARAFLEATTQSLEQWQTIVADSVLNDNTQGLKQKHQEFSMVTALGASLEQEMEAIAVNAKQENEATLSVSQQVAKNLDMAEDSNRLLNDVLDRIANLAKKLESAD